MSHHVALYVPDDEYEEWKQRAEEMGMSLSDWGCSMIRAGQKKFTRDINPSKSRDDLRQENNDLRRELRDKREYIAELEEKRHSSERQEIVEYLEDNPGAEYEDIVQHIINTARGRVTRQLDDLEGHQIEIDDEGRMYARK